MRTWKPISRGLLLPFRHPLLLALSVGYSALLYAAGTLAGFLDIRNPYWVVSAGGLLLLSPIYHALLLPAIAFALNEKRTDWRSVLGEAQNHFPRLLLGEIVVGAAVIAGGLLLLIPGIYFGMRLIYYKQVIVFGRASTIAALRESLSVTREWRSTSWLFLGLAGIYGCAVGLDVLLIALAPILAVHVGTVIGTGLVLTWMNTLVTFTYVAQVDST